MAFVNGYSMFLISSSSGIKNLIETNLIINFLIFINIGYIYFVNFKMNNYDSISLDLVSVLSLFEGAVMEDTNREQLLKLH